MARTLILTIGDQGLYGDELFVYAAAKAWASSGELLPGAIARDVHPPLYPLLMRFWVELFGTSELALRLPSLLAFVATLIAALQTERFITGGRTFFALPALLASSFGAQYFAQEARSYALLLLLAWLVTDLALRIVAGSKTSATRLFILHFVAASAAAFTHYFGFLVAAASYVVILIALNGARVDMRRLLVSGALWAGLFLPWLVFHYGTIHPMTGGRFWIENDLGHIATGFARFLFGAPLAAMLAAALLLGIILRRRRELPLGRLLPLLGIAGLTVLAAAAISLHTPIITPRNLIVLLPAILMGVFLIAVGQRPGMRQYSVLALLAGVLLVGALWGDRSKEQWREAGAFFSRQADCDGAHVLVLLSSIDVPEIYQYYVTAGIRPDFIGVTHGNPFTSPISSGLLDLAAALERYRPALLASPCPVAFWGGHVDDAKAADIERLFREQKLGYLQVRLKGNLLLIRGGS